VLSDGVDFSQYINNPILLWMHQRANGINKDQILPLGRVVEIRREGDAWTGQLEFDENDTFAMSVYNKYEAGVLNMISLGAIPLEISDDPKFMLSGQQNPTVIRCLVTDISCVDIGGNPQSLPVQLYDAGGNRIALSFTSVSTYLKLAKNDKNMQRVSTSKHTPKTQAIVKNAVNAGKLTDSMADSLLAMPVNDDTVDAIYGLVKSTKIDPDKLDGLIPKALMSQLSKSYDEISNGYGGFNDLKAHAPEVYKAKFFEKNGRLPAEKDGKPL